MGIFDASSLSSKKLQSESTAESASLHYSFKIDVTVSICNPVQGDLIASSTTTASRGCLLLVLSTSDLNQWGLYLEVNVQIWYRPAAARDLHRIFHLPSLFFCVSDLGGCKLVTLKASFLNSLKIPKSGNGQVSHFLEFTQQLAHQEFETSHIQLFYLVI